MKVVTRAKCVLTYSKIESGNFESGHKSKVCSYILKDRVRQF